MKRVRGERYTGRVLTRGELLPHFEVRTIDGRTVRYADIWQQRGVALVLMSESDLSPARALLNRAAEFSAAETELVVTQDDVPALPHRGAVVADRWGEIVHVAALPDSEPLPDADDLLDWVTYAQMRCPECEGETK